MKIKDYEETKRKTVKVRKIKKETDLFLRERNYYLEQLDDDKTWKYYWFKKEMK